MVSFRRRYPSYISCPLKGTFVVYFSAFFNMKMKARNSGLTTSMTIVRHYALGHAILRRACA